MTKKLLKTIAAPSALLFTASLATSLFADDTELYSATYQSGATGKPKVLVLFDDSGSMSEVVEGVKPPYDPNATYVEKVPANRIYWNTSGNPPDVNGSGKDYWFTAGANGCGESISPLATAGRFTGTPMYWQEADGEWRRTCTKRNKYGNCTRWENQWNGDAAGWKNLDKTVNNPYTVDCRQDVLAGNDDNASGIGDGYPRKANDPDTPNGSAYTTQASSSNVSWGSGATLFTSHYMNWYYDTSIVPEDKDYLQIAQEAIEAIIRSNPNIDFGLGVFNNNDGSRYFGGSDDGGRIVKRIIKNMTETDRDSLIDVLWGLDHDGNTPLCETAWEAYLYLNGMTPKYHISGDSRDVPLRDTNAESGGKYVSPMEDCTNTYIIYMTDGLPTADTGADALVKGLKTPNLSCRTYSSTDPQYGDIVSFTNCLAPLLEYMADDLDGNAGNGVQSVKTATIGFNVDPRADQFLADSATLTKKDGTPAYYYAESADELTASFTDIILGILSSESTFTSPAVAVDTFTRTQSRNDVFYAMFEPGTSTDWWGNIKKFKLEIGDDEMAVIEDADGNEAFNSAGLIRDAARTYWSPTADGPKVAAGGVGGVLQARNLSTRDIRSNTGTNGALETFNIANVDAAAYGFPDAATLYAYWMTAGATDFANTIRWAWGYDVDDVDRDADTNETRKWIMADILHSKPLVVNYGALDGFTNENPDMRIVVGTNNGMLHMFNNTDGEEDWAFFPKELGPVLAQRRKNIRTGGKNVYGVDAPPVVYEIDKDRDGTLDYQDGDKVYLYFGLRRGGRNVYALDISNPDNPAFLWTISNDSTGFGELGQTWSTPVVTRIPGYQDANGKPKPVLIFGGGYDEVNDSHDTLADTDADTMGRGIFIVDALTGELVWSVTPAANSAKNMQASGLAHAIAADVTIVDSNGDQLTDRIYAADVGGNVWRIDLPGNALPTSSQTTWFITHLLDANNNTEITDRRFFNAPDVVRTRVDGKSVDAVMIGSGDRTNPIAKDIPGTPTVDDQFYMIRDQRTTPYAAALDPDDCDDGLDFRCVLPLQPWATSPVDLYNITSNQIQDGSDDEQKAAALAALGEAHGWQLDLGANGEKALARALTIGGKLFFTTFSPVVDVVGCGFSAGSGRLYEIDLHTGTEIKDFDLDENMERSWIIGGLIPHTPSPYFAPGGDIWLLLPPGDSGDSDATGNPFKTGASLPGPYGSYWDRGDYP